MQRYFLESRKTDNIVELLKDENQAVWMEKYYVDKSTIESAEEFRDMLQNAFDAAKKNGGEIHSQYVHKDEWNAFLRNDDRWELIQECDEDINHIACDIDDAPGCIIKVFLDTNDTNDN